MLRLSSKAIDTLSTYSILLYKNFLTTQIVALLKYDQPLFVFYLSIVFAHV
jgi:hypothetical protein